MHIYDCPDGTQVPSVTTILKIIGYEEIYKWANYLGFRHITYQSEMDRTANIRNIIHAVCESVVDPENVQYPTIENEYDKIYYQNIRDRFKEFISQFTYQTVFTEKVFVSKDLGFGGCVDWYAKIGGYDMLVDFKSSKEVRSKHLLQLGGYYSLMKESGYNISAASIILVNVNEIRMYPINEEVLQQMSNAFLKLVDTYKTLEGGKLLPKADRKLLKALKEGA